MTEGLTLFTKSSGQTPEMLTKARGPCGKILVFCFVFSFEIDKIPLSIALSFLNNSQLSELILLDKRKLYVFQKTTCDHFTWPGSEADGESEACSGDARLCLESKHSARYEGSTGRIRCATLSFILIMQCSISWFSHP